MTSQNPEKITERKTARTCVTWDDTGCPRGAGRSGKVGNRIGDHNVNAEEYSEKFPIRRTSARVSVGQDR